MADQRDDQAAAITSRYCECRTPDECDRSPGCKRHYTDTKPRSAATKRRKPTEKHACVDLLARQIFLTAEVARSADNVSLVQAMEEWDNDRLLPEAYARFKTLTQEALDAR